MPSKGNFKIQWERVKLDYVCGCLDERGNHVYPSYAQLAKKYHCHADTVRAMGAKEKWPELRRDYQEKVYQDEFQETLEIRKKTIAEIDNLCIQISDCALRHILFRMRTAIDVFERDKLVAQYGRTTLDYQKIVYTSMHVSLDNKPDEKAKEDEVVDGLTVEEIKKLIGNMGESSGGSEESNTQGFKESTL